MKIPFCGIKLPDTVWSTVSFAAALGGDEVAHALNLDTRILQAFGKNHMGLLYNSGVLA